MTNKNEDTKIIVVSNPPFSKSDAIFQKLFEAKVPFLMIMNFNGLFDSKARFKVFSENKFELLIPYGRMKFLCGGRGIEANSKSNSPHFQSVYVCSKLLDKQIVFVGEV